MQSDPMLLDAVTPIFSSMNISSFSSTIDSLMGAGLGVLVMVIFMLLPLIFLFEFLSHCRVFQKAGIPLWAPLVPIYNVFIYFKVIKKSYWYVLVMLIPVVNIYFYIKFTHCLSKKFGYGAGFTIGLVLLPFIFIPILAWDKSEYEAGEVILESEQVVMPIQEKVSVPVVEEGALSVPLQVVSADEEGGTLPPIMPPRT